MALLKDILQRLKFVDNSIKLVLWVDTTPNGDAVVSELYMKFEGKMNENIINNIIFSINEITPVVLIFDGCNIHRCDSTDEFARRRCEGCK